ncbi:MAG: CoA pyrophosphatase [Gammaproteobacteria bacterium]
MNAEQTTPKSGWVERLEVELQAFGDEVYAPALEFLRRAGRWPPGTPAAAAVLAAIVEDETGPALVLTRRRDDLVQHAGQVALPGGAVDAADPTPQQAALREAEEEVGLPRAGVRVLGCLPRYPTTSGYLVTPVVGHVATRVNLVASPDEVADIFTLPLPVLVDSGRWEQKTFDSNGVHLPYWELNWVGQRVWGATAGMLQLLLPPLRRALENRDE